MKFTLDTNCLIDVDEGRDASPFVEQLLNAAENKTADVAMVVSSALERQRDGALLHTVNFYRDRMDRLGFAHIEILPALLRVGLWSVGRGIVASEQATEREALIYTRMFPGSAPEWQEFATQAGVDPDDEQSAVYFRWRNRVLDAKAFWAHDFHGRDVFVTSDKRFRVLQGDRDFPRAIVRDPSEAAALL